MIERWRNANHRGEMLPAYLRALAVMSALRWLSASWYDAELYYMA